MIKISDLLAIGIRKSEKLPNFRKSFEIKEVELEKYDQNLINIIRKMIKKDHDNLNFISIVSKDYCDSAKPIEEVMQFARGEKESCLLVDLTKFLNDDFYVFFHWQDSFEKIWKEYNLSYEEFIHFIKSEFGWHTRKELESREARFYPDISFMLNVRNANKSRSVK